MDPVPDEKDEDVQIDSRLPLWIALIANSASFAWALPFFWVSPSASIRIMGELPLLFVIGVGALVVLPLVLLNLKRLRGRTWPKYAVVLSLTPIPLFWLVETLAHKMIGYQYSP